jgi:lysophospholipase L1-like esterase
MMDRLFFVLRASAVSLAAAAMLASCGGPTQPSQPPPPTTDAPAIKCPDVPDTPSPDGSPVPVTYSDPIVTGGQSPFTLACAPVSGAQFQVGTTQVTCTVTDAAHRTASCSMGVNVFVPVKPQLIVTRFVAFGDSITWGENGLNSLSTQSLLRSHPAVQFPTYQTYPGVLQNAMSGRYTKQSPTVDNQGLRGETVTGSTDEPKEAAPLRFSRTIAGGRYDVALIMEGANDLANRDSRVYPGVIAGLRSMILDAKSRNMRVLLATIPPEQHGCCPDRGLAYTLVGPLNVQVRGLAAEQQVALVDVEAALSGDVGMYIGPDGLHPTLQGYAKIADTFFDVIKQGLETQQTARPTSLGASGIRPGAPSVRVPAGRASSPSVVRKPR